MKKFLSLALALILCLGLCACDNNKEKESEKNEVEVNTAKVKTNEGTVVEVSAQDLFNEYDANEARFLKIYGGATIEFVGTVKTVKVETEVYNGDSVSANQNKIVFEEGWTLIIGSKNETYDLADYYPGQKLKVSTGIVGAPFDTEFLQTIADNERTLWLVGNDEIYGSTVNSQTTEISTVSETK